MLKPCDDDDDNDNDDNEAAVVRREAFPYAPLASMSPARFAGKREATTAERAAHARPRNAIFSSSRQLERWGRLPGH